jgi:hypothetical protein
MASRTVSGEDEHPGRDQLIADGSGRPCLDPDTALHIHGALGGDGYAAVVASIHGLAARMFQVSILASARGPVT